MYLIFAIIATGICTALLKALYFWCEKKEEPR